MANYGLYYLVLNRKRGGGYNNIGSQNFPCNLINDKTLLNGGGGVGVRISLNQ